MIDRPRARLPGSLAFALGLALSLAACTTPQGTAACMPARDSAAIIPCRAEGGRIETALVAPAPAKDMAAGPPAHLFRDARAGGSDVPGDQARASGRDDMTGTIGEAERGPMSLARAIDLAMADNPRIGLADGRAAEAEAGIGMSRSALLPQIDLGAATGHAVVGGFQPDGSDTSPREDYWSGENMEAAWRSDLNLSVRQLVYDFGAAANDVARAQVSRQSETLRAQDAREEVSLKVAETYLRILERRETIGLAGDHVDALKRILTMLDENQKAGNGTLADTKRVRARLIDAQTMQADAEADLMSAVDRFERYVARPPIRLAPAPLLVSDLPASVGDALAEVDAANPALLAGHAAIKAARHELDSQGASMLPRLQVESDTTVKEFLGEKDHTDVDARVMIALRYKLSDGGLQRSQADQLSAKLVQAELRLRDAEDEIETSLRDSYRALATARGKAAHLRQGVADSRRARQLYDEQFRGAKRTILELLDVQSAYFQARQAEIANKYVEHHATYEILRALGRLARSAAARG